MAKHKSPKSSVEWCPGPASTTAAPIRHVLRPQKNVLVLMAKVRAIGVARRVVALADGAAIVSPRHLG